MSRGVLRLLAALLLVTGAPAIASAQSSLGTSSARLVGRVIDARTRAGMASVVVRLDGGPEVPTADDGSFEFRDVAPGRHQLVASLAGFAPSPPAIVDVSADADARVEIEYSLGVTTDVRAAALPSPASPPAVSLGGAEMTGLQVASAVGGLDDISRVMQMRPGVAPSQDDRNDLMVRGGGAYETAVRLDGFELPTASHFGWPGAAGGGLSLIPSAAIQRASLETSGFSPAYGERASGVLDLETRTGAKQLQGRADVTAGGVLGLAEGPLPDVGGGRGSWFASVRRSILEAVFSRGESRAVPSYLEGFANLDLPLSKVHKVHVLALGSSDNLDVNWATITNKVMTGEQRLAMGGVRLTSDWSPRTQTALSLGWTSNSVLLAETDQNLASFSDHSLEHFLRVRADVRHTLGQGLAVHAGFSARHSAMDFDIHDGSYRNEWGIVVPAVRATWHDAFTDAAVYANLTWIAGPFQLDLGGRADRSGMTTSWYGSPRVRLEYRPGARWRLMASWGEYRQDLADIWLGSNPVNRLLDPIRCRQGTAGVEMEPWRGGHATVEGFAKRYAGYPIDPSVPSRVLISAGSDFESPLVGKLVAAGLVHADGVDLALTQRLGAAVTAALGYSYWDVREYNLEQKWIRADYDIRHQARVWLTWHGTKRWTASAVWRYASGRPYTPYDVAASIKANAARYDRARTNAATYPAYHRLDARVERVFRWGGTTLTAFGEVDNLYDRDNVYVYDWSRALKQGQPILQWGITPVAGARIVF